MRTQMLGMAVFVGLFVASTEARAVCQSSDCICLDGFANAAIEGVVLENVLPGERASIQIRASSPRVEELLRVGETVAWTFDAGANGDSRWFIPVFVDEARDGGSTPEAILGDRATQLFDGKFSCSEAFSIPISDAFAAVESPNCLESIRTAGFTNPPCNDNVGPFGFPCASSPGVGLLALLGLLPRRRRSE